MWLADGQFMFRENFQGFVSADNHLNIHVLAVGFELAGIAHFGVVAVRDGKQAVALDKIFFPFPA
jgi:hypothetical protein